MIHTNMPRNCTVFLLPHRLTRSAIYGSQILTVLVRTVYAVSRQTCEDHWILLLKHLSNHMHFIKNGYKRFLYTNSSDPRQRVSLMFYFDGPFEKLS